MNKLASSRLPQASRVGLILLAGVAATSANAQSLGGFSRAGGSNPSPPRVYAGSSNGNSAPQSSGSVPNRSVIMPSVPTQQPQYNSTPTYSVRRPEPVMTAPSQQPTYPYRQAPTVTQQPVTQPSWDTRRFAPVATRTPNAAPAPRSLEPQRSESSPYAPIDRTSLNPVRVTTPTGQRTYTRQHFDTYVYGDGYGRDNSTIIINNGPTLLGGYYYSNYCSEPAIQYSYRSVYSYYDGFPQYIYNPTVIVIGQPVYPVYVTSYQPFCAPMYPVTYNQTNYYVTEESRAADIESGGARAREAVRDAYPADSYQAAFADIAHAWTESDISLLRKHLRDNDSKISVLLKRKYSYSISSDDFAQITRDAFDRLNTVSFQFTHLRKAKNGDVTAYGKHIYRTGDSSDTSTDGTIVPFEQDGSSSDASSQSSGSEKTVYVSYTLRRHDDTWYITLVDSSPDELVSEQK